MKETFDLFEKYSSLLMSNKVYYQRFLVGIFIRRPFCTGASHPRGKKAYRRKQCIGHKEMGRGTELKICFYIISFFIVHLNLDENGCFSLLSEDMFKVEVFM